MVSVCLSVAFLASSLMSSKMETISNKQKKNWGNFCQETITLTRTISRGVGVWHLPHKFHLYLILIFAVPIFSEEEFCQKVLCAVRAGHAELAAFLVNKDMKRLGIGSSFSRFHLEALVGDPG